MILEGQEKKRERELKSSSAFPLFWLLSIQKTARREASEYSVSVNECAVRSREGGCGYEERWLGKGDTRAQREDGRLAMSWQELGLSVDSSCRLPRGSRVLRNERNMLKPSPVS